MPRRPRRYHHGDLRRALLDAALAFLADGQEFTMRELARRAKVTHNAPYRHFADRRALLAAIAAEGFDLLAAEGARARDRAEGDPQAALRDLGASYVLFAVDHPHHFRLMFGQPMQDAQSNSPELVAATQRNFSQLQDAIEACRSRGLVRSAMPTTALAVVCWSLVHGLASLLITGQLPGDPRALAPVASDGIADVFFYGAFERAASPG